MRSAGWVVASGARILHLLTCLTFIIALQSGSYIIILRKKKIRQRSSSFSKVKERVSGQAGRGLGGLNTGSMCSSSWLKAAGTQPLQPWVRINRESRTDDLGVSTHTKGASETAVRGMDAGIAHFHLADGRMWEAPCCKEHSSLSWRRGFPPAMRWLGD